MGLGGGQRGSETEEENIKDGGIEVVRGVQMNTFMQTHLHLIA